MDAREGYVNRPYGRPVPQSIEEEIYEDVDRMDLLDYEEPPFELNQQVVQKSETSMTCYTGPNQSNKPGQHVAHDRKRHTHTSPSVEKQPKRQISKKIDLSAQTSSTKQSTQPIQFGREREREVETNTKKQPKEKLIKIVIVVITISAILVALILFITFILAAVQVNLLKETQGSFDRTVSVF